MIVDRIQSLSTVPGGAYALVGSLAVALGLCLVVMPFQTSLVFVIAAVIAFCLVVPRSETLLLVLFLLFQDPLQILAGGETVVALYVKRADEFLILAVALGCLMLRDVRRAFLVQAIYLVVLGCYLGLALSSVFVGRPDPVAASIDLVLFSKPFLFLAIGISLVTTREAVERHLPKVCLLLTAVLSVALVFLRMPVLHERYLGTVGRIGERVGLTVAHGFFIDTGTYSWVAVASFCLGYAAFLTFSKRSYLFHAFAAVVGVVITWRRKSLIAIAVVLLVSLITTRVRGGRQRALLLCGIVALLVVAILAPYLQALTTKTIEEYDFSDPYSTSRTTLYYTSLRIVSDHFPLGTGLASFGSHASRLYYSDVYREYGLSNMYGLSPRSPFHIADTYWPMVLGQGGIICLLSFLCFLWMLGQTAFRTAVSTSGPSLSLFLGRASLFLLIAAFIESMASQLYSSSLQSALLFITVGMFWRSAAAPDADGAS